MSAVCASALRCDGLSFAHGARRVVDNVSVDFAPGQWTAVVGPNGAGKSTLLQLLAGLRAPCAGQVFLHGRALKAGSARERARRLIWIGQEGAAMDAAEIAAVDIVGLGRLPHHGLLGMRSADDEAAVQAAMDECECRAFATRRLSQLSGGERQRVLLARALATAGADPCVWLFDEPTTHLDAPHQRSLLRALRQRAQRGDTVITVLHDITLALGAERVLVLEQGRVVGDDAPASAALHEALARTFGWAFTVHEVASQGGPRWVALPAE